MSSAKAPHSGSQSKGGTLTNALSPAGDLESTAYSFNGNKSKAFLPHPIPMLCKPPKIELTEDQTLLIARALADPRRYEILKKLGSGSCGTPCSQMRESVDISPATLSHHMKELETAGLVRAEKDGKFVHYTLQNRVLRAYLDRLKSDLA